MTSMRLGLPEREIEFVSCRRIEVEQAFAALATQQRYVHHLRMSQRICQSIDCFGVRYDQPSALLKLTVFCLFFGVVDDSLDERGPEEASRLLARFVDPLPSFTPTVLRSAPALATEFFKAWVNADSYADVVAGLHELNRSVCQERQTNTFQTYVHARRMSGRLTADVAYRLIAKELQQPWPHVRSYMCEVAQVGNLIDSLVDLSRDRRLGVLSFRPTLVHRARLLAHAVWESLRLLSRYPRMAPLFGGALRDVWRDSWCRRPLGSEQEDAQRNGDRCIPPACFGSSSKSPIPPRSS